MKQMGKFSLILLAVLTSGVIGGVSYLNENTSRQGLIQVPGLKDSVNVAFDKWGIPHIEAGSIADAFYSLGYVHAQDRILQMEIFRRLAQGRLSEIIGNKTVELDRFFRILGISRYSQKIAAQTDRNSQHIKAIEAYLGGVNAFLASGRMPIESHLLPELEPFTLKDVYSIAGYMTYSFDRGLKNDILRLNLSHLSPSLQKDLFGAKMTDHREGRTNKNYLQLPKIVDEYMDKIGRLEGSNSIVISGSKTNSGYPILANDTHIKFSNPSVWYEAALKAPGMEVYGHFLPLIGLPLIGHNTDYGWAITIFHNEDIDLIPETAGSEPHTILRDGKNIPLTAHKNIIERKGHPPLEMTFYDSIFGPEVGPLFHQKQPITMRWSFLQQNSNSLEGFYNLIFADDIHKAQQAVYEIDSPSLNISYANRNGDIGWWTTGKIKAAHDSYDKFIPKSQHPQSINPNRGYILSTNDQPTPETLGHFVYPQRKERFELLVQNKEKMSPEDIMEFQLDDKIDYHFPIIQALESALDESQSHQHINHSISALNILKGWKGHHPIDTVAPTIFYQFCYDLLYLVLHERLGEEFFQDYLKTEKIIDFLLRLINQPHGEWWDITSTNHQESMDETIVTAWRTSLLYLESSYGTNPQDWYWGKAHKLFIKHTFSEVPLIGSLYTIGPVAIRGGKESLNNLSFPFSPAPFTATVGPATRIIIDFDNAMKSHGIIPTGQSERALDPHFKDQLDLYIQGQYRLQLLRLDANESKTLVLTPSKKAS